MILLHHPESALSRELLATRPETVQVVDWSDPEAAAGYCGPPPSAFPCVVVEAPAYTASVPVLDATGAFLGMERRLTPAQKEALRLPASWAAVDAYLAFLAERALRQPVE